MAKNDSQFDKKINCPYCNQPAQLISGEELYNGHGKRELHKRLFWACRLCDAWVSCHPGTSRPTGTLAGRRLRHMRLEAHKVFDQIWKTGELSRTSAYAWLSRELGIHGDNCHIGKFSIGQCHGVLEACAARRQYKKRARKR